MWALYWTPPPLVAPQTGMQISEILLGWKPVSFLVAAIRKLHELVLMPTIRHQTLKDIKDHQLALYPCSNHHLSAFGWTFECNS